MSTFQAPTRGETIAHAAYDRTMKHKHALTTLATALAFGLVVPAHADTPAKPPAPKTSPKKAKPKLDPAERKAVRTSQRTIERNVSRLKEALESVAPDSGPPPAAVDAPTLKRVRASASRIRSLALKVKATAKASAYARVMAKSREVEGLVSRIRAAKQPRAADIRALKSAVEKLESSSREALHVEPVILE